MASQSRPYLEKIISWRERPRHGGLHVHLCTREQQENKSQTNKQTTSLLPNENLGQDGLKISKEQTLMYLPV